ncbi:MAG: transpeptidase family protein [Treponema sp.]|jgi:cell division protein FtsI (penicillin-binding protein 3)|nr:transpeptidase family protein [Treponema sp.]
MSNMPKWRFFVVMCILAAATTSVVIRYGLYIREDGTERPGSSRTINERGQIVDRNGRILATQVRRYDIHVRPPRDNVTRPRKIAKLAAELAPFLDMSVEEIAARIGNSTREFVIKRQVPMETWDRIRNEQDIKEDRLTGVAARAVPFRVYPEKNLASQVIGFMGDYYRPLEGVEAAMNRELSGTENGGRGSTVVLTIDANVQHILENVAASTLRETQAETVMFLAMDPRSGEILGSAVLPNFDPNDFLASSRETYLNLTALEHYEPGSVFKVFSISSLLDAGVISEQTQFVCNGAYERTFPSGQTVRILCADGRAHGRVRPREIIVHSCNVGAAQAADRMNNQSFYQALLNYGFSARTGAWVSAETAGLLRAPDLWSGRTRQSIAFGQEIAVSALQIMQAASVIANGGVLVPPKIISRIVSADGKTITERANPVNASRRVIRQDTAQKMLSYMTAATTEIGTGWRASVEDLNLAVKTGTSQYRNPLAPGYSQTDFIASCLALLPAEAPSLALYVVIIKPRGETYGGRIAAPAIRQAAELLIDYLGIPRGRNPIVEHSGSIAFPEERLPAFSTHVPNFYGLSKKTLLPLLLRGDIRVEISGEGWVRRQFPPPGTPITANTVLELELE